MRIALELLLGLALLVVWPAAARSGPEDDRVAFVYVESNVGGASGGHFALLLGDRVYDYRASDDGLLLLERRGWKRFRFHYGVLENRPVHVADVALAPGTRRRLRDGFASAYLGQRRARAQLASDGQDVALLESLLGGTAGVRARGAGLLDAASSESGAGVALRERIASARGADFLSLEIARAERELAALLDGVRAGSRGAATRYRETRGEHASLLALLGAQDLDPAALVVPNGPRLSAPERETLRRFREDLAERVVALLGSTRPDRGRALFLAASRHHAVHRSLDESRLVLLDPLSESALALDARDVAEQGEEIAALARHAAALYEAERAWLLARPSVDTRAWQVLEERAAQHVELRDALASGGPVRETVERRPPERSRVLAPRADEQGGEPLGRALAEARTRVARGRASFALAHGYDLVRHNCATAVVAQVSRALGGPAASREALGGPLEGLGFVPFALFAELRTRLPIARLVRIASYRERRLAELADRGGLARLREATTLTSSLYRPRHRDTSFLLFSDDVFLRRPLYGLVNLSYGLATSVAGVLTAPLDRGRRLERGAYGVLFSLPELALFNVRKGSFDAATLERHGLLRQEP